VTERSVGGVGVLDKTVAILDALGDGPLGLAELARRTGMPRPTAHRLCAALEHHGVVARDGELRRIGPRLRRWTGHTERLEQTLVDVSGSSLQKLRDKTGESVQMYVTDHGERRCIAGLESLYGLRTIVEVGARLPLDVGSAGAVLREDGSVLKRGWAQSVEEREKGVASVSAPVTSEGVVVAAVSVSGPIERITRNPARLYAEAVQAAAEEIARLLAQ
jgi:DNA-binding IclR family transcriptional regulator